MKKIKSKIHDFTYIQDLSLKVPSDNYIEIPEEIFEKSQDLQKEITLGRVIFEGQYVRGEAIQFPHVHGATPFFEDRKLTEEVAGLRKRLDSMQDALKVLTTHQNKQYVENSGSSSPVERYKLNFATSNFEGLFIEDFKTNLFRDEKIPGNAIQAFGNLTSEKGSTELHSYFSKTIPCLNGTPVSAVLAMIDFKLDGGNISFHLGTNEINQVTLLDTSISLNKTEEEIDMKSFAGSSLKATIHIHNNKHGQGATVESFGILFR